jgi:hypothetical protein
VHFPRGVFSNIMSFLPPYHPCRCCGRCAYRNTKPNHLNCLDTSDSLRRMLKDLKCKTTGSKQMLVNRLFDAGGKARRPYWDTKNNALTMRRKDALHLPLLTFDQRLHCAAAWKQHLANIVDCVRTLPTHSSDTWRSVMRPLPVRHHSYYDDVLNVSRMHGIYLREMRASAPVDGYKLMKKKKGIDPLAHNKGIFVEVVPRFIHPGAMSFRFKIIAVIQRPTSDAQPCIRHLAWRSVEPYTPYTY